MTPFAKQRLALRYWLHGRGATLALEAMQLAEPYHQGTRKDGVTPEFAHPVAVASQLRTLLGVRNLPLVLAAAFLHDTVEDYNLDPELIALRFGAETRDVVWRLTKVYRGVRKSDAEYYAGLAECPHASLVKAADRIHNVSTMIGVFTPQKVQDYLEECDRYVFPMLKAARRRWPDQEPAYVGCETMLRAQTSLIRRMQSPGD